MKTTFDGDLVASAYNRGSSIQELADANGISYGKMHAFLSARDDVKIRPRGGNDPIRRALRDERNGVRREARQGTPRNKERRTPPRPPGRILRAHISQLGVTQAVAAKQAGIPATDLSLIIRGKRTITIPMARKLQAALRIDAERLLVEQVRWQLHSAAAPQDARHAPLRI